MKIEIKEKDLYNPAFLSGLAGKIGGNFPGVDVQKAQRQIVNSRDINHAIEVFNFYFSDKFEITI